MGFSRQEYWSGLPFPSPGDLPDPGIGPRSTALQADALTSEPPGKPGAKYIFPEFVFDLLNLHTGDQHSAAITLDWLLFSRYIVSASLQPRGLYFQL